MYNLNNINTLVESLKYKNSERVKKDIQKLLNSFHDLRPSVGTYVFKNFYGNKRDLINISGTIPIIFKGKTYNIPLRIWVPENYPSGPPDSFVTPTLNMVIKPSKYIDSDGKIFLPYFKDWKSSCDLVGSIHVMQSVFGEHCPVFSKGTSNTSAIVQPPPQTMLPYPPYPAYQASSNRLGPPLPPPPYPSFSSNNPTNDFNSKPNYGFSFPNLSPQPNTSNYLPYPSQGSSAGVLGFPQIPNKNPINYQNSVSNNPFESLSSGTNSPPIEQDIIKLSLQTMLKDKIHRLLIEPFDRAQIEMNNLIKTEQQLKDGFIVINNILTVLDKENEEAQHKLVQLEKALDEGHKDVEKYCRTDVQQTPGDSNDSYAYIDEAVDGTTPVFKQILNAYAEESAIVDTVFYLGEALKKGAINLDDFLKTVRELSRRQFMLKALMRKCRKSAGLAI